MPPSPSSSSAPGRRRGATRWPATRPYFTPAPRSVSPGPDRARPVRYGRVMDLVLYDYWRSSASYRVRIALGLKAAEYARVPVDLLDGDQQGEAYRARNPQGLVPMLEADGERLTQSLAIIAWLDAHFPDPPLLPTDPGARAHVLALALTVAADIHPLNNLRVLKRLTKLGIEQEARDDWYRHWVRLGFEALEALAAPRAGRFL